MFRQDFLQRSADCCGGDRPPTLSELVIFTAEHTRTIHNGVPPKDAPTAIVITVRYGGVKLIPDRFIGARLPINARFFTIEQQPMSSEELRLIDTNKTIVQVTDPLTAFTLGSGVTVDAEAME